MPYFSVIIPTFNRADMIVDAIDSVFAQDFRDYEVIVVDDGSTDDTFERLGRYSGRVARLRQANRGAGAARNLGIRHASGRYVVFLDSDDLFFPWALATYRDAIERYGEPSIVMGTAVYWSDPDRRPAAAAGEAHAVAFADYLATAAERFVRTACVLAVRRDRLTDVGGFTAARVNAEDYDLLYRLGTAPGFVWASAPPVVAYRQHAARSSEDADKSYRGVLFLLDQERNGRYPGGPARRRERRGMIMFGVRNASWWLLEQGRAAAAWDLYRRGVPHHLCSLRLRYLVGFPLRSIVSAFSSPRRGRARRGDTVNIPRVIRSLPRPLRRHKVIRLLSALSPRSRNQVISFNGGARFSGDLAEVLPRSVVIQEAFEPEFFRTCVPFLNEGGAFLDVGANFGLCSFGMLHALPSAKVECHLFEPNPHLCEHLKRSAALYPAGRVVVNNTCVGAAAGTARLRVAADAGLSYIAGDDEGVPVPMVTLDDYVERHDIGAVRLMKLDVEGYETYALRGMIRALSRGRVGAIHVEVISRHLERAGSSAGELLEFLEGCGFSLFQFRPEDFSKATRNSFIADPAENRCLVVNGAEILVRPLACRDLPAGARFHTDLLAIHRAGGLNA